MYDLDKSPVKKPVSMILVLRDAVVSVSCFIAGKSKERHNASNASRCLVQLKGVRSLEKGQTGFGDIQVTNKQTH